VKRKRTPASPSAAPDTLVPEELLRQAKEAFEADREKKLSKCVVCGEECAPSSSEGLCWVCRRLKLSAWRDADTQMPAQE
jgi:hypothetical protein